MNFLNHTFAYEDLRDCTLITKNGTKIAVNVDSIEFSGDICPKFEGHIIGIQTVEPKRIDVLYCKKDFELQMDLYRTILNSTKVKNNSGNKTVKDVFDTLNEEQKTVVYALYGTKASKTNYIPEIKNVIFNDPATIVFWDDGTKTVVKCQDGDEFDPEKGLAMAIVKKTYGNKGNYCNKLKKWLPKSKKQKPKNKITFREEAAKKHPEHISACWMGGVFGCPRDKEGNCTVSATDKTCRACWDRVIPDELMDND